MLKKIIAVSAFSCFAFEATFASLPDGVTRTPEGVLMRTESMSVLPKDQGKNHTDIKVVYKDLKDKATGFLHCSQGSLSRTTGRKSFIPDPVMPEMNGSLMLTFEEGKTTVAPTGGREGSNIPAGQVTTSKLSKGTEIVFLKNQKLAEDAEVIACKGMMNGRGRNFAYALGRADATQITISNDDTTGGIKIEFDKSPSLQN